MNKIKDFSSFLLGIAIIVAIASIIGLVLKGGIWIADTILPAIQLVSGFTFFLNLLVFLPLCFIKKTRGFSAVVMYISSYIFGLELWLRSLLFTYILWGGFWVTVGLLFAGAGVLPMALLATAFNGHWLVFFWLCVGIMTTYGSRMLGRYFTDKIEFAEQEVQ